MTPRQMTALDPADDQLARALRTIREHVGDNPDVVRLVETIERRPAVRKVLARKNRGGKSARQAAALAQRNQALRQLHAKLYATLQPGAAAALIATKFRRYEAHRWPRDRAELVAPLREPERTFWAILRGHDGGGPKMPGVYGRSPERRRLRQLAMILERSD